MSESLQTITPIAVITEFYTKMRDEIDKIDTLTAVTNTVQNIKCNQNRDQWLLCYTFKQANDKKLYEQGKNMEGNFFRSLEEYTSEVFNYKGTSAYDFIQIAEQFEMEESANYIIDFGISKTKLLARLKKENFKHFNEVMNKPDEILNNSVEVLLSKWFKQDTDEKKVRQLSTSVKDTTYDLFISKAKSVLNSLPDNVEEAQFKKEDIDRLFDFVCYLKNKTTVK